MILRGSFLRVIDDSGVSRVKCLRPLKNNSYATLGDFVKVSVRKRFYTSTVLKRTLCVGLIVNLRRPYRRLNGIFLLYEQNSVLLLNESLRGLLSDERLRNVSTLPREVFFSEYSNLRLLISHII